MRKTFKILAVFCLCLFSCIFLNGCDALDELREQQAFYTEDGDILVNGVLYKELPQNEYLSPPYNNWDSPEISLTEKDVPVLLSIFFADDYLYPDDNNEYLQSSNSSIYYCREDIYDEIASRIENDTELDNICYTYDVYSEETDEYSSENYFLTTAQQRIVRSVLSNITPTDITNDSSYYYDYEWQISIEFCSEDLLFRDYVGDICVNGNEYTIITYSDDGIAMEYRVPEVYEDTFKEITQPYIEVEEAFWETYYDEEF